MDETVFWSLVQWDPGQETPPPTLYLFFRVACLFFCEFSKSQILTQYAVFFYSYLKVKKCYQMWHYIHFELSTGSLSFKNRGINSEGDYSWYWSLYETLFLVRRNLRLVKKKFYFSKISSYGTLLSSGYSVHHWICIKCGIFSAVVFFEI